MTLVFIILFVLLSIALLSLAILGMSLSLLSVPYVPVSSESLEAIIKALNLNTDSTLYDLGSGDGKVLFACFNDQPRARFIGIEYHFFPHLLALRKRNKLSVDKQTMHFIHGSFFDQNISNATHIFTYLIVSMMDKVLPKLEKELKPGTRLVSIDFPFTQRKAIEIIDIPDAEKRSRCKKIYIYEF